MALKMLDHNGDGSIVGAVQAIDWAIGAKQAGVNLRILQGDRLVTTSQTQYGVVLPDVPALRLGEGIAGLAARDNRVLVVPDFQSHPDIPAFIKTQAAEVGLHSTVSIPIRSRNSVIGVLSVNSARPRVFTEDESAALAICAEQAAIAIENAQLVDEVKARQAELENANTVLQQEIEARQRAEEALAMRIAQMESVHSMAEEITRELNLSTLLDLIVRRAADLVEANRSVIYLWDEGTHTLRPRAWYNTSAWLSDMSLKLEDIEERARRDDLTGVYNRRALVLAMEEAKRWADITHEPLSICVIDLVGVPVVMHSEPGAYCAQDRSPSLLATRHDCHQAARLFEDSAWRQARLATILDMNKRIAAHEDMASLLAQIAEEAKRLIGADGAILRLLRGDQLVAVGPTPYGPTATEAPEMRLGEGIAGRAALENRGFMVPDVQAHPDIAPFRKQRAAEVGVNAMLVSCSAVGTRSWGCSRSPQPNTGSSPTMRRWCSRPMPSRWRLRLACPAVGSRGGADGGVGAHQSHPPRRNHRAPARRDRAGTAPCRTRGQERRDGALHLHRLP
jgi:GAF domain-containing protein